MRSILRWWIDLSRPCLVAAALLILVAPGQTANAEPTGSISVQVLVDGEDRSGGSFRIVVLPAGYPQPVVSEEVERFSRQTERGQVTFDGLEPGRYLVAIVLAQRLLKETPPASVEVRAPEWVQNSSGVTSGFWPAFTVEISATNPRAAVTFVKLGDPPLPPGFVIPHTGGSEPPAPQIAPPDTGDAGLR
jgi:hypothetical protein